MKLKLFMHKLKAVLFASFFAFGVAQCGDKDSNSNKVKFNAIPDNPVVITAPITILPPGSDEEETVSAPWFLFAASVTNNSEKELTLVSLKLTSSGVNPENGSLVSSEYITDASEFCADDEESRPYLAILDPGQVYENLSDPLHCDPATPITAAAAGNTYESWYISGLPDIDPPVFNIEVEGSGWFSDANGVPIERLTLSGFFATQ